MSKSKPSLIVPPKARRSQDAQVAPVPGRRGNCMLCGYYSDLTESHVFPKSVGNNIAFKAYGYHSTSSGEFSAMAPRNFPGGVAFYTLCANCNNGLGQREDRVVKRLFDDLRVALRSPSLWLPDRFTVTTTPNRLFRAILATLVSSNDKMASTALDVDVREIFSGKKSVHDTRLRVYYWPYTGPYLTIIRDLSVSYDFFRNPIWMHVAKFKPVGFAVSDSIQLKSLPCLNTYLCREIDDQLGIPFYRSHRENHPHWPAEPGQNGAVLSSSESPGIVAAPSWRNIRPR